MNNINNVPENIKILLVDDEPGNIMLLTKMLSVKGYNNIISTLDPKEVLSIFQENIFDLVLIDINMPEMNGYEVLEQLRQTDRFNGAQVVAVSGDIYAEDIKKALDSGFTDYLAKPMSMKTLFEMMDGVIERMNG